MAIAVPEAGEGGKDQRHPLITVLIFGVALAQSKLTAQGLISVATCP
jgi:hypothetical protein